MKYSVKENKAGLCVRIVRFRKQPAKHTCGRDIDAYVRTRMGKAWSWGLPLGSRFWRRRVYFHL